MINSRTMRLLAAAAAATLAACGDDTGSNNDAAVDTGHDAGQEVNAEAGTDAVTDAAPAPASATLTIGTGMTFATPTLIVAPGATIHVVNNDNTTHTVTSEAQPDAFTPSGTFDTGDIAAGGSATINISASATPGTVYHYYCKIHTGAMSPKNGTITVHQ